MSFRVLGMRVGELESLTWGDLDEPNERWRISRAREKTRRGRFVPVEGVPPTDSERRSRAPAPPQARLCSPRTTYVTGGSRFGRSGVPWAQIGQWVGQRSLAVTADTYTHVLADDAELDRFALLAQMVHTQVHTQRQKTAVSREV